MYVLCAKGPVGSEHLAGVVLIIHHKAAQSCDFLLQI